MQACVEMVVSCDKWPIKIINFAEISNNAFSKVIEQFAEFKVFKSLQICVLLTNDRYMRYLNKSYRNKDKPTNVLSFSEFKIDYRKIQQFPDTMTLDNLFLGNIAMGYQTLQREAKNYGISISKHFTHLAVHGILHLLGFDHEIEQDAQIMENLERQILNQLKSYIL